MQTPQEAAQKAWATFEMYTREMGDTDFLLACEELECMASDSAIAKREEIGGD